MVGHEIEDHPQPLRVSRRDHRAQRRVAPEARIDGAIIRRPVAVIGLVAVAARSRERALRVPVHRREPERRHPSSSNVLARSPRAPHRACRPPTIPASSARRALRRRPRDSDRSRSDRAPRPPTSPPRARPTPPLAPARRPARRDPRRRSRECVCPARAPSSRTRSSSAALAAAAVRRAPSPSVARRLAGSSAAPPRAARNTPLTPLRSPRRSGAPAPSSPPPPGARPRGRPERYSED